jgi:hypothetical protein
MLLLFFGGTPEQIQSLSSISSVEIIGVPSISFSLNASSINQTEIINNLLINNQILLNSINSQELINNINLSPAIQLNSINFNSSIGVINNNFTNYINSIPSLSQISPVLMRFNVFLNSIGPAESINLLTINSNNIVNLNSIPNSYIINNLSSTQQLFLAGINSYVINPLNLSLRVFPGSINSLESISPITNWSNGTISLVGIPHPTNALRVLVRNWLSSPTFRQPLRVNGSSEGYVEVDEVGMYAPGQIVFLSSNTAPSVELKISYIVGNRLYLKLNQPNAKSLWSNCRTI